MNAESLAKVAGQFDICGIFLRGKQFGNGHINDTFLAVFDEGGKEGCYIIQQINHDIFKDPQLLMDNTVLVTEHILAKLKQQGVSDIGRKVRQVIPAVDGNSLVVDESGNYWRAFEFIDNASTYEYCPPTDQIYQAAKAFGDFQVMLADLPAGQLKETIPDFHNSPKRFNDFLNALNDDVCSRSLDAKTEIKFMFDNSDIFNVLANLVTKGQIPLRIAHNDTKVNNIMFDDTSGEAICVLDLDTVMPGLSLFDFGDIVRTTVSDADEDEQDLSKVSLDIDRFKAIVKGYLASAGTVLNRVEKQNLLVGAKIGVLEQAIRFLTDHLQGDTYFKIHRPNHNLDRCRTQVKLYELILDNEQELNEIIAESIK